MGRRIDERPSAGPRREGVFGECYKRSADAETQDLYVLGVASPITVSVVMAIEDAHCIVTVARADGSPAVRAHTG